MRAHQARHRVATLCRVLGVSRSGYYAWCTRPVSARATTDALLTKQLHGIHACTRGTYGVPAYTLNCGRKACASAASAWRG